MIYTQAASQDIVSSQKHLSPTSLSCLFWFKPLLNEPTSQQVQPYSTRMHIQACTLIRKMQRRWLTECFNDQIPQCLTPLAHGEMPTRAAFGARPQYIAPRKATTAAIARLSCKEPQLFALQSLSFGFVFFKPSIIVSDCVFLSQLTFFMHFS